MIINITIFIIFNIIIIMIIVYYYDHSCYHYIIIIIIIGYREINGSGSNTSILGLRIP